MAVFLRPTLCGGLMVMVVLWAAVSALALAGPPLTAEQKERLKERDRCQEEVVKAERAGKLAEAVAAAEKMLAIERQVLGDNHEDTAGSLTWLTRLYGETGSFDKARAAADEAVKIQTTLRGAEHWQTLDARRDRDDVDRLARLSAEDRDHLREARALLTRAVSLYRQNKLQEALEPAGKALEIRKTLLGEEHPKVAAALMVQGYVLRLQKNYKTAAASYRQAAAIRKNTLGDNHPDTAFALNGLAICLDNQSDLGAAQKYYEQALAIHRKAQGDEHLDVAIVLSNLGYLFRSRKDLAAARSYFEQSLAIRRKVQGAEHADTVQIVKALDSVIAAALKPEQYQELLKQRNRLWDETRQLRSKNKVNEAVAVLEKLLPIQRQLFGHYHSDTAAVLMSLAALQERREDFPAALKARREVLAVYRNLYGERHWWTIDARLDLSEVTVLASLDAAGRQRLAEADRLADKASKLYSTGKYGETLASAQQALAIHRALLGERSRRCILDLNWMGLAHKYLKHYREAEDFYRQALELSRQVVGEQHPDHALRLWNLALLCHTTADLPRAVTLLRQCAAIRMQTLGANNSQTNEALNQLVVILQQQSKDAVARDDLRAARQAMQELLDIQRKRLPKGSWEIKQAEKTWAYLELLTLLDPDKRRLLREAGEQAREASRLGWRKEYDKALENVHAALEKRQQVLPAEHPDLLDILRQTADLLVSAGKPSEAVPLYRRLLDIYKRHKDKDSYSYSSTRNTLFKLLEKQAEDAAARADFAAARKLRRQLLELNKEHFGAADWHTTQAQRALEHVDVLAGLTAEQRRQLAETGPALVKAREQSKARVYLDYPEETLAARRQGLGPARQALETRRRLLGDAHPATAEAQHAVGQVLLAAEDYKPARRELRQALQTRRKLLGDDHPDTLQSMSALSAAVAALLAIEPAHQRLTSAQIEKLHQRDNYNDAYRKSQKLSEAIAAVQKMLAIEREVRGDSHDETLASMALLAELYLKWSDFDTARRYADAVVAIKTRLHGADHWQTVEARFQARQIELIRGMSPAQRRLFWDAYYARWDVRKDLASAMSRVDVALGKEDKRVPFLIPKAEQVRDTVGTLLGQDHLYYANCLAGLAKLHERKKDSATAAALYLRAAEITGKALGMRNPAYAARIEQAVGSYASLARQGEEREDFTAARQAWQKRIDILLRRHGGEHWEVVNARLRLALSERLAQIVPDQRKQLDVEDTEKGRYYTGGETEKRQRVEAIFQARLRLLGENSRETAQSLSRIGELQKQRGDFRAAADSFRRALAIRKTVLGDKHLEYVEGLNELGLLLYTVGDPAAAEAPLRTARQIMGNLDRLHPAYQNTLNYLSVLYQAVGDLDRADECLREAQDVSRQREAELKRDPKYGTIQLSPRYELLLGQLNLATALRDQPEATLPGQQVVLPEDAATRNNRALIFMKRREFGRAGLLLREAAGIVKQTFRDGDQSAAYGTILDNLALIAKETGETEQAELLYHRAVELRRHAGADERLANALNNQGQFYFERGQLERADQLWKEAYDLRKNRLGERHPNTVVSLANLALLSEMRGDRKEAESLMQKALEGARDNLELAFAIQAERQQVQRMQALRGFVDYYLSLAVRASLPAERCYQPVLSWKGSVFVRQRRQRGSTASAPQADRLYRELEHVARELGALVLAESSANDSLSYKVSELTKRKREIEQELARLSGDFRSRQTLTRMTPSQLGASLPPGAALVDLLEYNHLTPPKKGETRSQSERRVLAFVLRHGQADVVMVPLGPAQPITAAVERWRRALEARKDDRASAVELRRLVWKPLEQAVRGARAVLLSPDGALARIPFAALPGQKPDAYLLEETPLAQVPVPQALPELLSGQAPRRPAVPSLLLLGDVDFGEPDPAAKPSQAPHFSALPGTAREIDAIGEVFTKTHDGSSIRPLRGGEATGEHFRAQAPGTAYLHLATHGFFAPAQTSSALAASTATPVSAAPPSEVTGKTIAHPGSLSGVVFAGANRLSEQGGGAILTASEVGSLDLRGTELVVLSACQTGLGDVAGGEGVLGLQRAFHVAGARSVVASLWKVNDRATAALMKCFYDNLWRKKMGAAEALRQAQLTLLHDEGASGPLRGLDLVESGGAGSRRPHPSLWAAWILSGDPGQLPEIQPAPRREASAPSPTAPAAPSVQTATSTPTKSSTGEPPAPQAPPSAPESSVTTESSESPSSEPAPTASSGLPWILTSVGMAVGILLALAFRKARRRPQDTNP
ncbi:MAG TPA: tetratricopeptide repeat protein [Gemmataceae bacterium]|nr:tetratricopeptide repeat protein [Gemmataceae bacterium]